MSIQFNLCNEPWLKYTLSAIADKGMKHSGWTSARLRSEVLFLETNRWGNERGGRRVGLGGGGNGMETRHTQALWSSGAADMADGLGQVRVRPAASIAWYCSRKWSKPH